MRLLVRISKTPEFRCPRKLEVKTLQRISPSVGVRENNHPFKMHIASQQPKKIILCEVRVGDIPLA